MDELVKMVSEKAGIPEAAARTAVDVVLGYLKDRLPEPIASKLNDAAKGQSYDSMSDIAGQVGGLFGKK